MERGLMWLPLLGVFLWLAWAGRTEYLKVEAYGRWAAAFDRAKYDILAVLGQSGSTLTWGNPTRQGPVNLQHLDLLAVEEITLLADGCQVNLEQLPPGARRAVLCFRLRDGKTKEVPFTDLNLAVQWLNQLRQTMQALQSASS